MTSSNLPREVHNASLVSITPDAEKQIVYMARVSNPSNQANTETSPRLIKYLIKHKHWSPFEMASSRWRSTPPGQWLLGSPSPFVLLRVLPALQLCRPAGTVGRSTSSPRTSRTSRLAMMTWTLKRSI